MSQTNLALLRRCTELLNVGDWEAVIDLYAPEVRVEFRDQEPRPEGPDLLHGREAVQRVAAHWTAPYDEFGAEVREYIDVGPWVICDTRSHSACGGEAVPVEVFFADAYEVRDGRIVRAILGFANVAAAMLEVAPAAPRA